MAFTAEKLGIELVELDRANCCGAGVIASTEWVEERLAGVPA